MEKKAKIRSDFSLYSARSGSPLLLFISFVLNYMLFFYSFLMLISIWHILVLIFFIFYIFFRTGLLYYIYSFMLDKRFEKICIIPLICRYYYILCSSLYFHLLNKKCGRKWMGKKYKCHITKHLGNNDWFFSLFI